MHSSLSPVGDGRFWCDTFRYARGRCTFVGGGEAVTHLHLFCEATLEGPGLFDAVGADYLWLLLPTCSALTYACSGTPSLEGIAMVLH
jgi:hypothetical protein